MPSEPKPEIAMAGPHARTGGPLDRLLRAAQATLVFERIWPPLVTLAGIAALFVTVSWCGLWLVLPDGLRWAGLLVFAAAFLAGVVWLCRLPWPRRADALARLDRDSGLRHRPFTTAEDVLGNPGSDPATQALWELHRRRTREAAARTRLRAPSPRLVERDRYALRAGLFLALVAAGFVAGSDKDGRLLSAFAWRLPTGDARATRIDAWIDPPAYTGRPPLMLLGPGAAASTEAPVAAPVGSIVVVRAAGADRVTASGDGGLKPAPAGKDGAPAAPAARNGSDTRFILGGDGSLSIADSGGPTHTVALRAIPDLPPRVTLLGTPKPDGRGALGLRYALEDDYGLVSAEARFSQPAVGGVPATGRSLVEAPRAALDLPATPGGLGEGRATLDLSDHPWAGARVTMVLSAHDEAGNTGDSKPVTLVLPARPFTKPLARALVEQRRNLVLDPDHRERVAAAIEALGFAPEVFDVPPAVYLGLHSAGLRLAAAKTDPELLAVADYLWSMALQIENGDLTQTEQDLRAAQKELRDALARGAPPDEIKRLTETLRKQMDKLLSELARKEQANPRNSPQEQASRTVSQKDLQAMLDRMEQAARNGDMAEAQRLLDQLNGIMNNLKSAKRGNSQSQATREMNRSMGDLERMMRDQGDVRDKTFKEGNPEELDGQGDPQDGGNSPDEEAQNQDGQNQEGDQTGKNGESQQPTPGLGALQRRQGALSQQLQGLQKRLRGLGMKGEQGLADAEQAMKQAEQALGKGQAGVGEAVGAQGRALEGLQKGMQGLGQQMAQSQGQGQGEGQAGQAQAPGDGDDPVGGTEDTDPLGRPRQGRGTAQNNQLDVSGGLAARAARVMEELRRRLGDPTRSPEEQEYLERLLKRY